MGNLLLKDYISLIAVLTSFIAVIAGPLVTFVISRRQMVSPIRQKWIDELRDIVSEYLSTCQKLIALGEDGLLNKDNPNNEILSRLMYLEQKLRLILNPNEDNHIMLLSFIRQLSEDAQHGVGDLMAFGNKVRLATEITQVILKKEWIRVKSGAV